MRGEVGCLCEVGRIANPTYLIFHPMTSILCLRPAKENAGIGFAFKRKIPYLKILSDFQYFLRRGVDIHCALVNEKALMFEGIEIFQIAIPHMLNVVRVQIVQCFFCSGVEINQVDGINIVGVVVQDDAVAR